jgi:hypothetical protein
MTNDHGTYRYFLSYSGVKLPLNLVSPVAETGLENRNTYFRASYDAQDRLIGCEKIVYGEVELRHQYEYGVEGNLVRALIDFGEEETEIVFGDDGLPIRA